MSLFNTIDIENVEQNSQKQTINQTEKERIASALVNSDLGTSVQPYSQKLQESVTLLGDLVTTLATQSLTNKSIDSELNNIITIVLDDFKSGVVDKDGNLGLSDNKISTQRAIKVYVDDVSSGDRNHTNITVSELKNSLTSFINDRNDRLSVRINDTNILIEEIRLQDVDDKLLMQQDQDDQDQEIEDIKSELVERLVPATFVEEGFLTPDEKLKLDAIEEDAQKNSPYTTLQGNNFNGAEQLLKLDKYGRLPEFDARHLINLPGINIEEIKDVILTLPENGQFLIYKDGQFINEEINFTAQFVDLTDVNLTDSSNGDLIFINDGIVSSMPVSALNITTSLRDLTDINAPDIENGQVLRWNNGELIPGDFLPDINYTSLSLIQEDFEAVNGQTDFEVEYSIGFVDVLINGVQIPRDEFLAIDGLNITLDAGLNIGDKVVIKKYLPIFGKETLPEDLVVGDLLVVDDTGTLSRIPKGTDGQMLSVNDANPLGVEWSSNLSISPDTVEGDILVANATGGFDKLSKGTDGQALVVDETSPLGVVWGDVANDSVMTIGVIDGGSSGSATMIVGAVDGGESIKLSGELSYDGGNSLDNTNYTALDGGTA